MYRGDDAYGTAAAVGGLTTGGWRLCCCCWDGGGCCVSSEVRPLDNDVCAVPLGTDASSRESCLGSPQFGREIDVGSLLMVVDELKRGFARRPSALVCEEVRL